MNYEQYRAVLIALIQALKAEIKKRPAPKESQSFRVLVAMLGWFVTETIPPHDGYALRNQVHDMVGRIVDYYPTEEQWAVNYELCRDILGMLDVPYSER